MKKYTFRITESQAVHVTVNAEDIDQAFKIVNAEYDNGVYDFDRGTRECKFEQVTYQEVIA